MRFVLAVDLGTSGPKVALVSDRGELVGQEFESVELLLRPGGGAEQSAERWWDATSGAAKRLLARGLVPRDDIVAIGCTTQWAGTVAVDNEARPLMNAVIWMDARGGRHSARVTNGFPRVAGYGAAKLVRWIRVTGAVPTPTGKDSLGHILYIKNELPDIYRRTYKFLEPMDYLNARLTGRFAASFHSITLHWLTDNRNIRDVRYDERLLALAGVDREKLPDLVPTGEVLGTVTPEVAKELGVSEKVRVVMGTADSTSSAVGAGAVEHYAPHLYIGTSSWLSCPVPFKKTSLRHSIASLPSGLPGSYLVATEQQTAGVCLTALRDHILCADDELSSGPPAEDALERFNAMAERIRPGSDGLIFTPWLNGERTPVDDELVRGGFFNQSLRTTRAHLVRAVFEGVAYNTRWMRDPVERFVGRRLDEIRFVGGGARSDLWCQIHADVLDRSIAQVADPVHANVRGAGLLAFVALGDLSLGEIPGRIVVTRTYAPRAENRGIYDALFREFVNLYRRNRGIFARLNRPGGPLAVGS
jgi:xylulokinase